MAGEPRNTLDTIAGRFDTLLAPEGDDAPGEGGDDKKLEKTDGDDDADLEAAGGDDLEADDGKVASGDEDAGDPGDDTPGDTEGEDPEGEDEAVKGKTPSTLDDLATQTGMPIDQMLDGIKHKFTVDGKEVEASLAELVESHQGMGHVNERLEEVNIQQAKLTSDHKGAAEDYQAKVGRLAAILKVAEQALMTDANSTEMKQLRLNNPAEWGARLTELQTRQQNIHDAFANVAGEWDKHQGAEKVRTDAEFETKREAERAKIKKAIPKWSETYEAEVLGYAAAKAGFTKEELQNEPIIDHRLLIMADKARKYDALVAKGKTTAKPVTPAKSKTLNPQKGAGTGVKEPNTGGSRRKSRELRAARGNLKKSGSLNDAADVFNLHIE